MYIDHRPQYSIMLHPIFKTSSIEHSLKVHSRIQAVYVYISIPYSAHVLC